jgi:hypothetical protein
MLTEAAGLAILAAIPLRRNGRMFLACTPVAVGLIVATDGLVGLTKKG